MHQDKACTVRLLHDLQNQTLSAKETEMCQQKIDVPYFNLK
jgi:hypothetical protein